MIGLKKTGPSYFTPTLQKSDGFKVKTHTLIYIIRRVIPQSGGVKGDAVGSYCPPQAEQRRI
jgi:hypothetical protein